MLPALRTQPNHTERAMNKGVRQYAVNSSVSLVRPELVEIKNTIKNLKKEAEMRLTLDVEAQQSFDFL